MLLYNNEVTGEATDQNRRALLRTFLLRCRARLTPLEVGLPETGRRRVAGLRREEVAELAGVSSDWYRWFESGRSVRVSVAFLGRLADALRLHGQERLKLYHLAVPEVYRSEPAPPIMLPLEGLLSPVQSPNDVEPAVRRLALARALFNSDHIANEDVRPRIATSWRRSEMLRANPLITAVPRAAKDEHALHAMREESLLLLHAALPTIQRLELMLADTGYAIVLADKAARILDMAGDSDVLRFLARIAFEPGGDLRESAVGTNAVGTVLADGRPLQLMGAENFADGGSDLTCTAAPIRDPITSEIIGVLDVTAQYKRIRPEMLGVIVEAALEIEERLGARELLDKPLRRSSGRPTFDTPLRGGLG